MKEVSHDRPFVKIDGEVVDVSSSPLNQSILDFLRFRGRTAAKIGCNEGDCGACTILLLDPEGPPRAINGCLALVGSLVGREIVTSAGLSDGDGAVHPAQEAMVEKNGSQCGYCTPGIVCSMAELAARGLSGDPHAVADQLCGNLCRCTGYRPIREAMLATPTTAISAGMDEESPSLPGFHRPETLAEALALKSGNPNAEFIAGATELAVLINKRHVRYSTLISLENVTELLGVEKDANYWHLGAGVPLTDLEWELDGEYPAIDQMLRLFASRQIRHRATLGGNLATASPIGDSAPVLLALDAVVTMVSTVGERTVPLAEFFTGYRQSVLAEGELLSRISIPRGVPGRCEFFKVSKRREMDISAVSAAIRLATDESGRITEARLAFGGVAATPARATKTEAALIGRTMETADDSELMKLLRSEFTPLDDFRGSADFRKLLIGELFAKYLAGESDGISDFAPSTFDEGNEGAMPHESARGHVTGEAIYVEDAALREGTLFLWPVRGKVGRGRIEKLDVSRAREAAGVHEVLTAADVPGLNNTGPSRHDEPLFACEEIEFSGQMVAAIVADSPEAGRLAAELIELEIAPIAPLVGIEAAVAAESFHTEPRVLARGDASSVLEKADPGAVIEGEFQIGGQEHFYLETHAASAMPDGEGGVFVQSSTQHPSEVQSVVAEVLGCDRNKVVVESPRMGGGFGGKETQGNAWSSAVALGALRTRRRVSIQLDRDVDMEMSGKRHPFLARFRVAHDAEGMLEAVEVELYSDGGWSLDLSQPVNDRALFHLDNAYYIPHAHFTGRVCKTNTTSHTAFRGFGGPQGMLVIEEIMARVAQKLGLPPEDVRRCNFYRGTGESNTTHYGEVVEGNRLGRIWSELLESSCFVERKAEIADWNAAQVGKKRGLAITPVKFGISFTLKHYNQAGALVLVYADGSVQVNHGGTEMGQGLHTKILSVAMRELGLPAAKFRLMRTRTDKVPNTSATAASSGSDLNGMAVADACGTLRSRLAALARERLDWGEGDIDFREGCLHGPSGASVSFEKIVDLAYRERVSLSAGGFYATPDLEWDWNVGKGRPFHYYAFGAAVSEVEIDGYTGMHHLRRVDILHDVGNSLNPAIDRGQIEGGFMQGAGWLTCEELGWSKEGLLETHSASTYGIPAFSDAPLDFRVALLKDALQDRNIHGSKAVGEPPLMLAISVREALRGAISAFGEDVGPLPSPLTPEVMKMAIGQLDLQ